MIILDTCYAAKGGSNNAGPTYGANEVIAATNEVIEAPGISRLSFTRVLVRVLKNFAEKHRTENLQLSAVWLCTHMRNYYYDQELKKPPYYVSLVNYRFESCRIVPRPHSDNRFLGELSPLMPPDLGPFRVMVAIYLEETPSGDLVSWLQGQGAPAGYINGVELINIQAAHLANSSMLLVTLPPGVWLLLPPEIPCTFVGMIRSGNLLSQEKASTTANLETKKTSSSSIEQTLVLDPPPFYEKEAIITSRHILDLQLRRQNKYWRDRVLGNVQFWPSLEQYEYRHLAPEEFRLIELLPGQDNDRLIGRLITVDPASAPQYVALSYVWGPPCEEGEDPQSILLDNIAIKLRPNLDSAMRALRSLDQDVYVWVDTLCINQHDGKDKDMQIPLMAKIYRLSDSVAVWLGETTSYGKVAFSFATWITKHPDLVVHVAEEQLSVLIMAFSDMIRNPCFQRKRFVADLILAKEVHLHYGKDVLPWEIMAGAVYILRDRALDLLQLFLQKNHNADTFLDFLADFRYQGVNQFVDLRYDVQRKLSDPLRRDPHIQLTELVTRTALLNASVIRDAVFTMIFLASEIMPVSSDVGKPNRGSATSQQEDLFWPSASSPEARLETTQPSYRTSSLSDLPVFRNDQLSATTSFFTNPPPLVDHNTPVQKLFSDFVKYTISSTRQLDIVCRPWAPKVSSLPSYVRPRSEHAFRVLDDNRYYRANADSLAVLTSTSQTLYSACGKGVLLKEDQASRICCSEEPTLVVEGTRLGRVDVIAPPAMYGILPKAWRRIGGRVNTIKSSEDWFWRTLVADRDPSGLACPAWYKLASEHLLHDSDGPDLDTRRLMFASPPGIIFDFLSRVQSVIWGRRLIILDQGYVVLGPNSCEAGDLVCILHGCSVPVLLRPVFDIVHEVIGECYVHGMMDGEVIVLKEQKDLPTERFQLV